ncbi:SDR family NAD(P)-dependent oxidoreductase [Novosphingobium sp. FSY-8]|uniref:SDR family NAD(P)-dependent oxidoreductase n=1 Tax=Novosphingobium ovatum TaxID=1908523 RepID=A0ABW9XGV2_9SPHN|nr:SDR family NAD(P)-dependent oxidoreductase [Novosphingobium ovatum]NBC37773.1 SDR family NAD(P)-dependent oxidoreductase [Novosphingobium ovatum]
MAQDGGKVAVVWGAGGGIGAGLVRALLARGDVAQIYAGSRDGRAGAGMAGVTPFAYDLMDEASIAGAVARMGGRLDLVIVASGVLHDAAHGVAPEKSLRAIDGAAMARVLAVNTIGPALIAKHTLARLPRDRRAVWAALSARVGSIGDNRLGGWHAYRASKAALNMLIANFAIETARTHPHAVIAALHPGTVASDLSAPFRAGVAPDRLFTPDISAGHLLRVLDGLTPGESGGLYAWDGARVPW